MSLEGPVTAVINSSGAPPGTQSFSLQPSIDQPPALRTSYANVTLAGEAPSASVVAIAVPSWQAVMSVLHMALVVRQTSAHSATLWTSAVEPHRLGIMPQASMRNTYLPERSCYGINVRSPAACRP